MSNHKNESSKRDRNPETPADLRQGVAAMLHGMALSFQEAASLLMRGDRNAVLQGPSPVRDDDPNGLLYKVDDLGRSIESLKAIKELVDKLLKDLERAQAAAQLQAESKRVVSTHAS